MKQVIQICDFCKKKDVEFSGTIEIKYSTGGNGRNVINTKEICLDCCTKIANLIHEINNKPIP
jgi:hypothetical protein